MFCVEYIKVKFLLSVREKPTLRSLCREPENLQIVKRRKMVGGRRVYVTENNFLCDAKLSRRTFVGIGDSTNAAVCLRDTRPFIEVFGREGQIACGPVCMLVVIDSGGRG